MRSTPADPACAESVEATGGATAANGGFAMQHAAALQFVPRLTLFAFARVLVRYAAPVARSSRSLEKRPSS